MADSVKTEGQDYTRETGGVPPPIVFGSFVHGEFSHTLLPGDPDPAIVTSYIHTDLTHQMPAYERSTFYAELLPENIFTSTPSTEFSHEIT